MACLRKYWTLLRIKIALSYFFPMALGFAVAADANPGIAWWKVPVGFGAFFCAWFFASTLNFYADVEADREFAGKFKDMDLSKQPFVTGEMGEERAAEVMKRAIFNRGLEVGKPIETVGMRASTVAEVHFNAVRVPADFYEHTGDWHVTLGDSDQDR